MMKKNDIIFAQKINILIIKNTRKQLHKSIKNIKENSCHEIGYVFLLSYKNLWYNENRNIKMNFLTG